MTRDEFMAMQPWELLENFSMYEIKRTKHSVTQVALFKNEKWYFFETDDDITEAIYQAALLAVMDIH